MTETLADLEQFKKKQSELNFEVKWSYLNYGNGAPLIWGDNIQE